MQRTWLTTTPRRQWCAYCMHCICLYPLSVIPICKSVSSSLTVFQFSRQLCVCYAAYKKEFQKLGDSFMALAKSFEFDTRPGCLLPIFCLREVFHLMYCLWCFDLPSVLWHCRLGSRKGIRCVKNWVVGCWRGYLSGARCRLACVRAQWHCMHCGCRKGDFSYLGSVFMISALLWLREIRAFVQNRRKFSHESANGNSHENGR